MNPSACDRLRETIYALRKRSASGHHFVPFADLRASVNSKIISDAVSELHFPEHHQHAVVATILERGLRVFSALALLHQEKHIATFLENDELDVKLPMEKGQVSRIAASVSSRFWEEVQWEFISHVFIRTSFHRKIRPEMIFPILNEEKLSEGAGGEIFKCKIAQNQQTIVSAEEMLTDVKQEDQTVTLIRKRIKMVKRNDIKKEQASKKEAECLEFIRLLRHEHIIELLASYEYRDEHYLLFPFYPMDLERFLSSEERFGEFSQNQTFYNALSGLISAVEAVHNLNVSVEGLLLSRIGYHHDIRPKNVLVTPRKFILTDFGLARLKVPDGSSHTLWKNTIGDYIAPECMDEDFTHMDIGRSIDIWSFGCLVSEVATYMEEGQTGVKQFRAQRRTTVTHQMIQNGYFFENNRLRASADDWLIRLSTNPKDRGIRCLVECVRQMLQVEVDVRPRAALISSWLDYVKMKALYHSILEPLQCLDLDPLQQNGLHSPYSRLDIWFEVEKLNAWGRVLGMHNDRPHQELFENDRKTVGVVHSILESFWIDLPPSQRESQVQDEDIETQARRTTIRASMEATLRSKVKDLWEAVPLTYQKRMEQSWRQSSLDTEDLPLLTRIKDEARLMSSPFSDIGMHAALKRLELEFWREGERSSHEQKELLLQSWQIEQSSMLSSRHGIGNFTPKDSAGGSVDSAERRVLLEWVIYSPIWQGQSDQEKIVKLLSLAEILHQSKPESFHVLECLGVLPPDEAQHQRGFGFVYAFPTGKKHDPVSLYSLLEQKHSMLLEDKFRIARCLAESISQLHTHGWLHKNIHTRNIVFFPNGKKLSSSTNLGQPYLIGFQHSRPNGEIWYSDMDPSAEVPTEHRDPRYEPGSNKFQRIFDYYSLGIVLLEVGFWEPIGQFRARHRNLSKTAFRDILVQKYVPKLGFKMGTTYMEVVADCLRSSFGENARSRDESEIEGDFFWTVVDKLSALKIC